VSEYAKSRTGRAERRCIAATLQDSDLTWTELSRRLGDRPKVADHLMNGRCAPTSATLALLPDVIVWDYLRRLRAALGVE